MIDWYLQTVYILPWWAYAAPVYFLIGAFVYRVMRMDEPRRTLGEAFIMILPFWPAYLAVFGIAEAICFAGWFLGFTDDLPPITERLTN